MSSPFAKNFRPTGAYLQVIQDFLALIVYKYNLKAPDVCVIATALGLLGTEPIRKNTKLPEVSEGLINESMDRGKEVFKQLAMKMAIVGPHRRFPGQKGVFNNN